MKGVLLSVGGGGIWGGGEKFNDEDSSPESESVLFKRKSARRFRIESAGRQDHLPLLAKKAQKSGWPTDWNNDVFEKRALKKKAELEAPQQDFRRRMPSMRKRRSFWGWGHPKDARGCGLQDENTSCWKGKTGRGKGENRRLSRCEGARSLRHVFWERELKGRSIVSVVKFLGKFCYFARGKSGESFR